MLLVIDAGNTNVVFAVHDDKQWRGTWRVKTEAQRTSDIAVAAAEIESLAGREVPIAGAIAYWCEGTKDKPYRRQERVVFINSDPALISFFLRFLTAAGVSHSDLIFRVYIHETADVEAAERFWLGTTKAHPSQFRKPALKRHNPKTVRKGTGENYHGCLRVDVRRSSSLYRKIEGWAIEGWASAVMLTA